MSTRATLAREGTASDTSPATGATSVVGAFRTANESAVRNTESVLTSTIQAIANRSHSFASVITIVASHSLRYATMRQTGVCGSGAVWLLRSRAFG